MVDTFVLCKSCGHTVEVHSDAGCRGYKCSCRHDKPAVKAELQAANK